MPISTFRRPGSGFLRPSSSSFPSVSTLPSRFSASSSSYPAFTGSPSMEHTTLEQLPATNRLSVSELVNSLADIDLSETSSNTSESSWRLSVSHQASDVKELDAEVATELSLQVALGHHGQVKTLLNNQHDPNLRDRDRDRVPLHWAAARGKTKIAVLLLKKGADASLVDASGRDAAELARRNGHEPLAMLFQEGPPIPDPKQVFEGMDGCSLITAINQPARLKEMLKRPLVGSTHDANRRDIDGDRTPLHWAAARNRSKCIKLLLAAGASTDVLDAEGRTPLMLALELRQGDAVHLLRGAALASTAA